MEQDSLYQVKVDGQMIKTFRPIQQETLAEAHKFIEENHTKYYSGKVLQINAVYLHQTFAFMKKVNPQRASGEHDGWSSYSWEEVVREEHPFDIS